jgi:hypothetical protein
VTCDDDSNSDYEPVYINPEKYFKEKVKEESQAQTDESDNESESDYEEVYVGVDQNSSDKIVEGSKGETNSDLRVGEDQITAGNVETSSDPESVTKSLNDKEENVKSDKNSVDTQNDSENCRENLKVNQKPQNDVDPLNNSKNDNSLENPIESTQEQPKEKSPFEFSDLSSDEGLEDNFEFTLENLVKEYKKSDTKQVKKRKEPQVSQKFIQPTLDQVKSTLDQVKSDPKRMAGGFKKGTCVYRKMTSSGCKYCDTMFLSRQEKEEHQKTCKYLQCDPDKYICMVCGVLKSKNSFQNHNHNTKCFYCDKAILNPSNKKDVGYHIRSKHPGLPFEWPVLIDPEGYFKRKAEEEGHLYEEREKLIATNIVRMS